MGSGLDIRHLKSSTVKESSFAIREGDELDFKICVFLQGKS